MCFWSKNEGGEGRASGYRGIRKSGNGLKEVNIAILRLGLVFF